MHLEKSRSRKIVEYGELNLKIGDAGESYNFGSIAEGDFYAKYVCKRAQEL